MYVPYQSDKIWNALFDAAKSGIESGIKSVVKDILNAAGKAVLQYYCPAIADLFFNSDETDANTQQVIDEIRATHSDLADRHRDVLEEIQDIYRSDLIGSLETAMVNLEDWNSHDNPILRMDSVADLSTLVIDRLTEVRETIEEYILLSATDPRAQFQRLQLLPQHIEAARLEITTRRLYWSWRAIKIRFEAEHSAESTRAVFEAWSESLSQEAMAEIQAIADGDGTGIRRTYENVLEFYETLTTRDDLANYVEAIFTPLVGHMETFNGNVDMYDNESVVNDDANWGPPEGDGADAAVADLDGKRWYYYVDVPGPECLEGFAYRRLSDRHYPRSENPDEPSQSECNRYWIVNPDLFSTTDPEYFNFRASLDGYDMWFGNSLDIYEIHKELVKGDLLRTIYGPSALILDAMYREVHDNERPSNRWDVALDRYDELVGLLGAGRSYEEALAASEAVLDRCGVSPNNPGLFTWYEMIRMQMEDPLNPPLCPDSYEENNTFENAAIVEPGYYNHVNLNVPGEVDFFQFELLADNSVLVDCDYDDTVFTSPLVVELWGQLPDEDEPALIESASEHDEYGLAILLPQRADMVYRHPKMKVFVKVYSPDNQTGPYAIGIQTKGLELASYSGSGSGGDDLDPMIEVDPIGLDDEAILARDVGEEPYRVEPQSIEESESAFSLEINRTITLRSTVHTGGRWIRNHSLLNQTAGADIDRYVVEVPAGLMLEITTIPTSPEYGMPYAKFEDNALMRMATNDYSHWPEGGHRLSVRTSSYRSTGDVYFLVSGLYNDNYRRDTGAYRLIVTVTGIMGFWFGLGVLQRAVADDARKLLPSPHDLRALSQMYVEFVIVKGPDNPGDPFVLAAMDYVSGSVINYYKFDPSEYKSDMPFKEELKSFNEAHMGSMTQIIKKTMNLPQKYSLKS